MSFRDTESEDQSIRIQWNNTPKNESPFRKRSNDSRRKLFAASPSKLGARSAILDPASLSVTSGSRRGGFKRQTTEAFSNPLKLGKVGGSRRALKLEESPPKQVKLDLPPRPPSDNTEEDLRKEVMRQEAKRIKDEQVEEESRKLREAEMKKLNQDQKGKEGFGFSQRLKKGDFTFDTYGKAMLVKKQNPSKLPDITSETNYKVKYPKHPGINSMSQSGQEASART